MPAEYIENIFNLQYVMLRKSLGTSIAILNIDEFIIIICAQAGYEVAIRDIEQRFVDGGMSNIKKNLGRSVEKKKITQDDMDSILGRINPTLDLKVAASNVDLVVEVVRAGRYGRKTGKGVCDYTKR